MFDKDGAYFILECYINRETNYKNVNISISKSIETSKTVSMKCMWNIDNSPKKE